jgi:hypothetical protein
VAAVLLREAAAAGASLFANLPLAPRTILAEVLMTWVTLFALLLVVLIVALGLTHSTPGRDSAARCAGRASAA